MRQTAILFALLVIVAAPGVLVAAILSVPQQHATIQEALDEAEFGDQVLVSAGTYYENIEWPRQSGIRLTGAGAEVSVIDGQGITRVISFPHGGFFTSNTTIEGFTITGGEATGPLRWGGGIWLSYGRTTIQDCIITGNHASSGGGILSAGNSTLRRLVVWGNEASNKGGGLLLAGSNNEVDHCSFSSNTADTGPGVYLSEVGETLFSNNIISGNFGGIISTNWVIFDPYPPAGPLYVEYNNSPSFPPDSLPVVLGPGNITAPPQFVDNVGGDLHLENTSPCVDAGDPNSPLDPDGTRSDIGALSLDQSTFADGFESGDTRAWSNE
jgi:hypothetical protein